MRNLIVMTTGGEFDLAPWMRDDRNYDIVFLNWGKYDIHGLGIDVHNIASINFGPLKNIYWYFRNYGIGEYEYYWFPDDDLEFTKQNEYFDFIRMVQFDLSQPSMTADSNENHDFLYHKGGNLFRDVPFVEIMCPCFSRAALERNFWTFDLNHSGYGVDLLWAKHEQPYVVDAFQIRHSRPQQMCAIAERMGWPDPQDELKEIQENYL